jgi:hypothetical protein
MSKLRRLKSERGQLLVMAALSMTLMLIFAALTIDVGMWLHTKTKLQADVDAMALAGAQRLPATGSAQSTAEEYAGENGLQIAEIEDIDFERDCSGVERENIVTVRGKRHNTSTLAQLIGITGTDIRACATAGRYFLSGVAGGVRPFAIENDCADKIKSGGIVTIKWDSGSHSGGCTGSSQGNYNLIDVDYDSSGSFVTGKDHTQETILNGNTSALCIKGSPNCCEVPGPDCVGLYKIQTEPGNAMGPVVFHGVDELIANTARDHPECDTYAEVVHNGELNMECAYWRPGYTGGAASSRLIIIPIVDGLYDTGGRNTVDIEGFALLFVESAADEVCLVSEFTPTPTMVPTRTPTPTVPVPPTVTSTPAPATATATVTHTPTVTRTPTNIPGGAAGNCNGNGNYCSPTPTITRTPTQTFTPAPSTSTPTSTSAPGTSTPTQLPATVTPTSTHTPLPGAGTGNDCDVRATFIKSLTSLPGATGSSDADANYNLALVKLIK